MCVGVCVGVCVDRLSVAGGRFLSVFSKRSFSERLLLCYCSFLEK